MCHKHRIEISLSVETTLKKYPFYRQPSVLVSRKELEACCTSAKMAHVICIAQEVKLNYFSGPVQPMRLEDLFLILMRNYFLLVE